jgi:hypothetical protein
MFRWFLDMDMVEESFVPTGVHEADERHRA